MIMVARDRLILNGLRKDSSLKTKGPTAMAAGPLGLYFDYSGLMEIIGQNLGKSCLESTGKFPP